MKIINLTPHAVGLVDDEGVLVVEYPSAGVARAAQHDSPAAAVVADGVSIPTVVSTYGELTGLPEFEPETMYIVSGLTVSAAREAGREVSDLLTPAQIVRDSEGRIVGCGAFARYS